MNKKMTKCKVCGQEIAKSAKVCPHCGAKNKKPIFKKWWFWVIIVVLFIAIGTSGNDTGTENVENIDTKVETSVSGTGKKSDTPKEDVVQQETIEINKKEETKETALEVEMTTGQKNALKSAKSYLDFSAFSYEGLIKQLEFEKYSHEDAVFAADNCGADWNEQALKSAKSYLDFSAFSYTGLIKQLEFEKYTTEQAIYGADNCGADWNEQAAKSAKSYLSFSSFSEDGLIKQLEFEGFTKEQAEYGAKEIYIKKEDETTEIIKKEETKETALEVEMTTGQKNALKSAKSYLDFSAFSYEGLIKQLEFEKYSHEDAVFAADNCGADWNEQALKSAKSYLDFSAFSYTGLIKQLEFEKYTTEQAIYGADNCGADWNEQAAKSAKSYLSFSSFSKDSLIKQLEFEGFTKEQAEYGAKENGY